MSSRQNPTMRVLQIAPRVCWPLDTGAKRRNYHLGRIATEHAIVTLLAFSEGPRTGGDLENLYRYVFAVPRDRHNSFPKILRGAIGRTPLPLLNLTTRKMKQELKSIFTSQVFDIVQFESIHLMPYLPIIRSARKRPLAVLDWHNIESELMQQYSDRESNVFRRAYARRTARLMREFERRALREFDAHAVVSHKAAAQLRHLNPDARIFVIENGVDTAYYSDVATNASDGAATKNRVVLVAPMDNQTNIDAVASFARDVWPRVRKDKAELILTIVGSDPAPEVRELASVPGVEVTGTVGDVRPYYREALAAIVPFRVGGGSERKILEAMAAGVPVISTTLGAEGLDVKTGENILIANSDEELREAIIDLSEKEDLSTKLIEAGRALVSKRYDWSIIGARLVEMYQSLLRETSAHSASQR